MWTDRAELLGAMRDGTRMASRAGSPRAEQNRLLASLPSDEYARIARDLHPVRLEAKRVVSVPGEPIRYVYFVRDAIISLVVAMADGTTVEGATVGNEGVVGLGAFLGDGTATECMIVQITGQAAEMSTAAFREAIRGSPRLQFLVGQYTLALMNHLARTAGCNRLHAVQQRYARWLLMSADRLGRTTLPLTHESLAILLGVRRASVSEAAEMLQRAGLIAYQRGRIAILDREGLERAACEDYRLSRDGYDRIYG